MKKISIYIYLFSFLTFAQTISPIGIRLIKHYEGFRGKAYLCPAGVLTIGYGETKGVYKDMLITEHEASLKLIEHLHGFERYINRSTERLLKWNEFDALVSFTYNVGFRLNNRFKSEINRGDTKAVVNHLMLYIYSNKRILSGLIKRRKSESTLYCYAVLHFY